MSATELYEQKLQKLISVFSNEIKKIYYKEIDSIALTSAFIASELPFNLDDFPTIKKQIDKAISSLHGNIKVAIINSINLAWDLSNKKNDQISDDFTEGMSKDALNLIFDPNKGALMAFKNRIEAGLNLSDRIWNSVDGYRVELEAGLTAGINAGESAAEIATNLKKYLKEPDKLFRRVRDENGNLQLSKAAKAYHPGQGVYRSSYQNALRLTGTETNISYQTSDFNRWQSMTFLEGIEVEVSNNHPVYDICNEMAGKYPQTFHFVAWHPNCRCHAVPIVISGSARNELRDYNLGLRDDPPVINKIKNIPARAKQFVEDNADRINGWASTPYFIKNNPSFFNKLIK